MASSVRRSCIARSSTEMMASPEEEYLLVLRTDDAAARALECGSRPSPGFAPRGMMMHLESWKCHGGGEGDPEILLPTENGARWVASR
jgi:hypothetical protein